MRVRVGVRVGVKRGGSEGGGGGGGERPVRLDPHSPNKRYKNVE